MTDNHSRKPKDPARPFVESWFFRANHRFEPKAIWIKATILAGNPEKPPVAEAWGAFFDGEQTVAFKHTVPLQEAVIEPDFLKIGSCSYGLDSGQLQGEAGGLGWNLKYRRLEGFLGEPLCLLPSRKLVDAAIPKNKLLSPVPAAWFSGQLQLGGKIIEVEDWVGMQGHNWGPEHARSYAWGQCVFWDEAGQPFAVAEGASGRIKLGPFTTPVLSLLTVRHGGKEYRFDRILDLWNQKVFTVFPGWSLRIGGPAGVAELCMEARPEQVVCLGYENPDASMAWCLNSKLASVTLKINPTDGEGFLCRSQHGGALEFLSREAIPPLPQAA